MKKLGVVLAVLAIFALIGCGSGTTGGAAKSSGGSGAAPFKVDLSKLSTLKIDSGSSAEAALKANVTIPGVKNQAPLTKAWGDVMIFLPKTALPADMSKYTRFTVTAKYYDATGAEIEQSDSQVMVVMVYDVNGDLRGPSSDAGPNTPVKQFNVGGYSGLINKDRGIRVTFKEPPQAVLFQNNSGSKVAFIELTSMVFHNGDYKSE